MSVRLLTEHHLEFLSLTRGCRGSSESTLVKMPHCWKSHDAAQMRSMQLLVYLPFYPWDVYITRNPTENTFIIHLKLGTFFKNFLNTESMLQWVDI